ncbi:uncharacterized protein LOC120473215 [Pimephales promelas]|uniref:uncharacterized protein LOC120473215 n=1 Tax=Pimephales promelas TaxID=90988 RepID=UPI001955D9FB|nr:uncharacterized protein LOC120473215 [Pimephales promelas]
MMLIFGLMLLQTAACVEFTCRFGQPDPCYAALGHKLNLQMVDDRIYKLKIKRINNNQDDPFCKVRNDNKSKAECDLYNNRTEVTVINGTLIINRVVGADSGIYTLHIDHSDGTVSSADLQVKVEAPIGSVNVSLNCSSSGGKSVSCSSDGDLLIYSWTLNGDPLTNANTNIHLNETTEGVVICSVKNHVSQQQKDISIDCPGTTTVAVTSRLTSTMASSKQAPGHAPIGSVNVSLTCSSSGGKSVSCSSDGDSLVYSWTLNGDPLTDANTNIHLNETTEGVVICSVKNHVSDGRKGISLDCSGTTTVAVTSRLTSTLASSTQTTGHGTSSFPTGTTLTHNQISGSFYLSMTIQLFMIILGCVALVLILLFITVCHFYKRKQVKSTPAPAGDTELVYAQISHEKHNKKRGKNKSESLPATDVEHAAVGPQTKRKELKEEEVQYGEVTFTPNQSNAHRVPKEECLYAQVQRP